MSSSFGLGILSHGCGQPADSGADPERQEDRTAQYPDDTPNHSADDRALRPVISAVSLMLSLPSSLTLSTAAL